MHPHADEMLTQATYLEAEIARIHPIYDGNDHLMHAWMTHTYGVVAP